MHVLKRIGILLLGLVALVLLLLHLAAIWFRMPDAKIAQLLAQSGVDYRIYRDTFAGTALRWVEAGHLASERIIFFSHGAPGGFQDFAAYMVDSTLTERYRLISMDRPGYGYSDYGNAHPSILEQVAAVRQVLEQYPLAEVVLVGYSYGGPIAAAYAGSYPESVEALVLLAPVIAPEAEPYFWFNSVLHTRLARWLLPRFIDVANEEKLQHAAALRQITPYWKQIEVPVYHLHCKDDWIAPFTANTSWSKAMLPAGQLELITWDGDSHFLPGRIKERVDSVFRVLDRAYH